MICVEVVFVACCIVQYEIAHWQEIGVGEGVGGTVVDISARGCLDVLAGGIGDIADVDALAAQCAALDAECGRCVGIVPRPGGHVAVAIAGVVVHVGSGGDDRTYRCQRLVVLHLDAVVLCPRSRIAHQGESLGGADGGDGERLALHHLHHHAVGIRTTGRCRCTMERHAPHVVTRVVCLAAIGAHISHESMILLMRVSAVAAVHGMLIVVDGVGNSFSLVIALGGRGVGTFLYLHKVTPKAGRHAQVICEDTLYVRLRVASRHPHIVGNLQFPGQEFLAFATNIIATANGTTAHCLTGVAVLTGNGYHGTPVDVGVASPAMDCVEVEGVLAAANSGTTAGTFGCDMSTFDCQYATVAILAATDAGTVDAARGRDGAPFDKDVGTMGILSTADAGTVCAACGVYYSVVIDA